MSHPASDPVLVSTSLVEPDRVLVLIVELGTGIGVGAVLTLTLSIETTLRREGYAELAASVV